MPKTNIKIFISSHKPARFLNNHIFQPIQVGAALNDHSFPAKCLRDDTGKHISADNPRFCELTAQYWAWKNFDAEYYGFFHYRRYLSFCTNPKDRPDLWGNLICPALDDDAVAKYHWNESQATQLITQYDIILPQPHDIRTMPSMGKTLRDQYAGSGCLHAKDLDIMLDVLREKYPDYLPYAENYLRGHQTYLNNMFIMKKELFRAYCDWLFDILFECDRRIDYSGYSIEALRTPGHLAERLLNIYIAYLKDHATYRIAELPTVFFLETDPPLNLQPAFKSNNNTIVLSANEKYVPYVATLIASIRENSSPSQNYDLLIMHKDISDPSQRRLQRTLSGHKNFSLRFINVASYEHKFKNLFLRGHFTIETWFRLLMPELLPNYDKVLYLDSDLVVNSDLAKLYQTDIHGYLLAACHDADTAGLYNGAPSYSNKRHYIDHVLKLNHPYDYFQAGVILFNLAEFRQQYTTAELLKFAASRKWELLDQDVLNCLAQGQVKPLDMSWNVMFDWRFLRIKDTISRAPKRLYDEYMAARTHPKIIHFAGPDKPWDSPNADFADVFWHYARLSGYYEDILLRAHEHQTATSRRNRNLLRRAKRSAAKLFPPSSRLGSASRKLYHRLRH